MSGERQWNVGYQGDGWPMQITAEEKETITAAVRELLARPDYVPLPLYLIERHEPIKRAVPGVLWDYRYACVERALRAAGAGEVWMLEKGRR